MNWIDTMLTPILESMAAAPMSYEPKCEPVAWRCRYSDTEPWTLARSPTAQWAADHSSFEEEPLYSLSDLATEVQAATEAERKACASIADDMDYSPDGAIAKTIRARQSMQQV